MKTLKYLFIAALAILSFNACEDVPEPYEIPTINGAGGGSNVSTPEGEGTLESPYNAAGANAYISTLGADENSDKAIYVKGIICNIKEAPNSQYGNATFYISADGKTTSEQFYVFRCHNLENKKFTDNDVLNVGDEVIIYGKVVNYKGNTPETVQNEAYIYSHNATTTEPEEIVEMTVAEAIAAYTGTATPAAVKGYIVGWVEGTKYEEGARFNNNVTEENGYTDIMLADSPDETDPTKCIPVQLPSGAVRSKVNIKDNPDNYKKLVTLTGSIEKYFGVPGLKSVTKALFEGESDDNTGEGDDTEEPTGKIYLKETFAESLGAFKTAQIVNDYAWKHEVYNEKAYAKVSGYANGASQDAESWLISPAIDFTGETVAKITFDYVVNKGDASLAAKNHQLMITDNYTGDFYTTEWTAVDFGATNDNTWTFRSASAAIPAQFMGKSAVVIAFKYTSTTSASSTWEVNNVVVSGNAASDGNTGEGDKEETPTGDIYIKESFETSFGEFTTTETVANYPWVIDYSCAKVTAYDSASKENNAAESWLVSPAIDFSKETEAYIIFDYVVRYTESGKVKDYSQLLISNDYTDDVATATWTAIDYNVKENPSDWNFYNTGKIAVPAEFMGKENVRIAFKYTSSATKAGTWEVKNVVVAKGAADTPDTPETPETPDTPDTPDEGNVLTVEQLIAAYNSGTTGTAAVTGYIVGTSEAGKSKFTPILGLDKASNTNIIIADSPNETDTSKCIPVQLPSGVVRAGVNLVDNPGNLGKKITLTGEIQKYFSMAGLRNATAYTIE